ncbi:hypothetical protein EYR36_009846 [Pleurotus pulmonarius]|nr:hypothetical protein EYR36_009846 [Pleurotus pulmonarius]
MDLIAQALTYHLQIFAAWRVNHQAWSSVICGWNAVLTYIIVDGPSGSTTGTKAIASLAKKQNDVTRQGTQKLKFMPLKRKKTECVVKFLVLVIDPWTHKFERPTEVKPVCYLINHSVNRVGLSRTTAPSLKREQVDANVKKDDDEVYSEPDEGVEIVDMDDVHQMDWMAPESLRRFKATTKKKRVKQEEDVKGKGKAKETAMDVDTPPAAAEVDLANALDLSESEEEEEMEDLVEDFARATTSDDTFDSRQDRLFWFQFPSPFPVFTSSQPAEDPSTTNTPEPVAATSQNPGKKVAFAPDTKPPAPSLKSSPSVAPEEAKQADQTIDGIIGQLEVYQSGAVKIRLGNGILLDAAAATQPAFLQHAVYLDEGGKRMCVLGEVNKRFTVSPNVDMLLNALEAAERVPVVLEGEQDMITMDDII